jgi:ABC-2 type transport system permease protein
MIHILRSEWIKIRTVRVNYVLAIIAAAFPVIVITLVAALNSKIDSAADDLPGAVTATMLLTAMLLGVIGALNLTSEYSTNTIRTSFAAVPQRRKVLIAKASISLLGTLVLAAVIEAVTFAIGAVILNGRGGDVSPSGTEKAAMLGAVVLAGMLSLLGYGLGLLIRNSPATVAILILWPLLLESIVRVVLSAAGIENQTPWLPYQSALQMANPDLDSGDPSRARAGLFLGILVVVFVVVGTFVNERRDA